MKKGKLRILAVMCAAVLCMAAFSQAALAADGGYYESNEGGDNTPPNSIDSITVSTEGVKLPEKQGSEALTPDGNLSLIDDILQGESYYESNEKVVKDKQFITVQTKSGNYFYIIIDRSGDTENVYFLNMVDEADLMALMEGGNNGVTVACTCTDKCIAGDVNTSCPVCKTNMSECSANSVGTGKESVSTTPDPDATTEPETDLDADKDSEKSGSNTGLLLVVLVIAFAGGGALYWFKLRKPKADTKGSADLDDYDYGEDEDDEEYEFEKDVADEDVSDDNDDKE